MIERVVCGFQTGADIAGAIAAKRAGIPTGGWMPKGFLTEYGRHPEYAELYGAKEHESPEYPPRTRANVLESDALLWFGNPYSRGGKLTLKLCRRRRCILHYIIIGQSGTETDREAVAMWIEDYLVGTQGRLMIAGNRESSSPGIGEWVERYLTEVFCIMKETTP